MDGDRERWNAKWRDRAPLSPPAPFLVEHAALLPDAGRALDVGGGAGRHTVWLAKRGLDVTMIDVSDVALERTEQRAIAAGVGNRVRLLRLDLDEPATLPPGPFDVIVMFHYLNRARRDAIAELLFDRGVLMAVQPTVTNLERNEKPGREYLVEPQELDAWACRLGLEIVVSREGWTSGDRHEAELIARRVR